jgi:hypothetical protein
LRAAFAVADVNEDESTEVAAGMNPAGQSDSLPDVCRAQFVAMMCAFHFDSVAAFVKARQTLKIHLAALSRDAATI